MKRFFIFFIFSTLILLYCGGGKELTTGNVYTDPVYNFTVTCPEGWRHFVFNKETRLRSVDTEYTRYKERKEMLRMDAGVEIDPAIYLKVITGNKDIKEYMEDLKKSYITEFFNLFPQDRFRGDREVSEEDITSLWGTQEAYQFEIKELHHDPTQRNPITQVYGLDVNTIISFTVFKKDDNIYHIEFICPEIAIRDNIKKYQDFVKSFKFD
ncbi:MAG: hypothetical protein HWN67_13415 [Candidatus Helarchaeota archaeon]|nr:hypothetical protein [Candidatus Helarchaeota archaeon]